MHFVWREGLARFPFVSAPAEALLLTFMTQRTWLVLRLLCALVWASELFWVQSLAFEAPPWVRFPSMVQLFRFYLDLVSALIPVLLLQRRFLNPLLLANLLLLMIVGTYVSSYHWPLMPVRAFFQWREAWSLHPNLFKLMPWRLALVLLAAYTLKLGLLIRSGNFYFPFRMRVRCGLAAVLFYTIPILGLQVTQMRLRAGPNGGYGRTVYAYGYSLSWICDLVSNAQLRKHQLAAEGYLKHQYDRITPQETPLPVGNHVVVLQLESVCANAIEAEWKGRPVMPFLKELKGRSMYFRIRAFHRNGSCDMDFAATTGTEPYPLIVPYRLPGKSYTNGVPAFMKQHGYQTFFFHGNTAIFYDRGPMMELLGFDRIFFKEQLAHRNLPTSCIGVRDRAVLSCMLDALRGDKRAFLFGITLDTHTPFRQLDPQDHTLFPEPGNLFERYLNSLCHLDECLREFVERLPLNTTLVMYGDHSASFREREFSSDVVGGEEYVPALIFTKGRDLSGQRTRGQPIAEDGSLNLLDVIAYVRRSVEIGQPMPSRASENRNAPAAGH